MTAGINRLFLGMMFVCSAFYSVGQTDTTQRKPDQKYIPETFCMNLVDGITVLMADGQQINSDILLKNGTKITSAGKVIRSDGTEVILKDKDCVDSSGQIIRAESATPGSGKKTKRK